jgi:hypothetical protein
MTSAHQQDTAAASPGALRRSGGLFWHLRALRYRRLHGSFRCAIASFLHAWHPACSQLIVVGPSAGWFLPSRFLNRFSRLVLIDLDTSAPFFFSLRHGRRLRRRGTELVWLGADFVGCLQNLVSTHPGAAILFCNVLGQLGLERDDHERRLSQLSGWLEGRAWASFHDRFSTRLPGGLPSDPSPFTSESGMDEDMLRHIGCSGEWTDHGTGGVLPEGTLRHYLPWRITPDRFHWIEAGVAKMRS